MKGKKRGRKNKYETHVKPNLDCIKKRIGEGATEEMVCNELGIGVSTFNVYKKEFQELQEVLKKGRQDIVSELRGSLIKRALGFDYEEKKSYTKTDENGNVTSYVEVTVKHAVPDVGALNLALKNYDAENWANDPQNLKLKREELELKKKQAENNEW